MDFAFEHDIDSEIGMLQSKGYLSEELNCDNKFGTPENQLREFFYGGYVEECRKEYYMGDEDPSPVSIYTSGRNNGRGINLEFKYEFECNHGLHFRGLDFDIYGQKGSIKAGSINLLPSLSELIQSVQIPTLQKNNKSFRVIKDETNHNRSLRK